MIPPATMARESRRIRAAGLALLLSAGIVALPVPAPAQVSGVAALLEQARYWRSKGREDLAQQALRRARALDPNNPAVTNAAKAPAPRAAPKPATKPAAKPAPAPAQAAAARPAVQPAPTASVRAGRARVAGFDALDAGRLDSAEGEFERALAANRRDPDALGGLGLVRLRQERFAEAADLLGRAASLGNAGQWADGLAAARFFAGIAESRQLLAQGQLAQAQSRAEELVRSGYKEPAPAMELLADIYDRQGRYADAADLYRQAAQGSDTDEKRLELRATRGRALAAAQAGDELGAIREFQQGLVLDPADPWIRYEFAQFMIDRGRLPEAEALVQSLVRGGGADSLYAAALLNADLGRPREAERLVDMIPEAQRTAPMRAFAVGVKADSAIEQAKAMAAAGQGAEALTALHRLATMSAIPPGKQAAIASAMAELGDTAAAASLAQQALSGQVPDLESYEALIGVLVQAGRDDLARDALQRAGTLAGGSVQDRDAYGRMQAALMVGQADRARLSGRFAEGFDILQAAYSAAPDNTSVLTGLARLYQSGQMPARAAQTWQLVLAKKPGDKEALLGLAQSAAAAGDGDLSERAREQALDAFPRDYQVRMALADAERARGNERGAVRLLKQARELYAEQHGTRLDGFGGNPFAAAPGAPPGAGANPFRDMPMPAAAPQVNPFALSGGTRLPAAGASYPQTGYPQTGYGQAGYGEGAPSYGAAAYAGDIGTAPAAVSPAYPPGGGWANRSASAPAAAQGYGGDPVMAQIQSRIAELAPDTGPRADVKTGYRQRSGETGLSQLDEIKGLAEVSTGVLNGRVHARAEAVVIDAGRPNGSGLARFGRNATPEAQAIVDELPSPLVDADSQHASGAAFSAGYKDDLVEIEGGTTPIGMGKTRATFRAAVTPKLSENVRAGAWAERKAVTDSVVSYAGTRDPVTGERWGQVMRTGGGLSLSYDRDGSGVYGEGRYYRFTGTNVSSNRGFEANVGGYLRAWSNRRSSLTVGLNVNYQGYDKSQNYFTFGNGGYFSPQSFISVGFPVSYTLEDERFDVRASFTPGFQSYSQDATPLYPTDPAAQAELDALKALNDDVRSYYDSISKTGFALSAEGSAYYKIGPNTRIGGEASYNTFGTYDEFRSLLGVRQSFGSGD